MAYCLYPRATLEDRISLICTSRNDTVIENVYERYRQRGWSLVTFDDEIPASAFRSLTIDRSRWIGGGLTWTIPLPYNFLHQITPVTSRSVPLTRDPVSMSSWTLIQSDESLGKMEYIPFKTCQLFYWYVVDRSPMSDIPSLGFLMQAANRVNIHAPNHFRQDDHH